MKTTILPIAILLSVSLAAQQNVGIGTASPAATAKLDVASTSQGVLLPRMSTAQREAIGSPATGLLVYDTDKSTLAMYDGSKWRFFFSSDKLSELAPTELTHPDVKSGDKFGYAVGISGNYAVVGAYTDTVAGISGAGSAYTFTNIFGKWESMGKFSSPDGNILNNQFAKAVAINGNRMVIAAPNNSSGKGCCYYYRLINNSWVYQSKIVAADGLAGDQFGWAISMDETSMAIGAPNDDVLGVSSAGSVYTYNWNNVTNTWVPGSKITANNDLLADANFGMAVSIDSNRLLVGAPSYSSGSFQNHGVAYYYTRTGNIWSSPERQVSLANSDNYYFGMSVRLTDLRAFISSPSRLNSENASYGRVSQYSITPNGLLNQSQYDNYPMDAINVPAMERYGDGLAGYGSDYWVIGAPGMMSTPANVLSNGSGKVYLIRNNFIEKIYLPPTLGEQGNFGKCIEMDANSIIISAPGTEQYGAIGKVFIYSYR